MFTPFRVTWRLRSAMVIPDRPMHLDALLAYAAVARAKALRRHDPLDAQERLPLAHAGENPERVWQASQVFRAPQGQPFLMPYFRTYDLQGWVRDRAVWRSGKNQLPGSQGHFRAYSLRAHAGYVERAVAWGVGDIEQVRSLLTEHVFHLGKMGRNGWGQVESMELVAVSGDEAQFWRRRTLPAALTRYALPEHLPGTGTFRPPYWHRVAWREVLEYPSATVASLAPGTARSSEVATPAG